eukprot:152826-Rhodomonas_salina.1
MIAHESASAHLCLCSCSAQVFVLCVPRMCGRLRKQRFLSPRIHTHSPDMNHTPVSILDAALRLASSIHQPRRHYTTQIHHHDQHDDATHPSGHHAHRETLTHVRLLNVGMRSQRSESRLLILHSPPQRQRRQASSCSLPRRFPLRSASSAPSPSRAWDQYLFCPGSDCAKLRLSWKVGSCDAEGQDEECNSVGKVLNYTEAQYRV